jgi:flagellar motor switch protein FliM
VNTKLQWSHGRLNSATNFTKPKKNNKYFWVFDFETRIEGNNKQSKIFLDFSNIKPKTASKANQSQKTKKANKEKQQKYFWSFCVLESRNKNKNNKESETWIYKVPTKYDM